jgi:predicted amidohydrolase YtcJ
VLPDALLAEVQATGAMVIGQPALVYERGDVYRAEFAPPQHGWLHRARSLLAAGIPYAIGSDAPVTNPSPGLALGTAQRRQTRGGAILGPDEALDPSAALAACTLGPAAAVGAADWLGHLGPGALADLAIMDPAALAEPDTISWDRAVRYTLMEGLVVWAR